VKANENEAKAKPEHHLALWWLVEQEDCGGTTEAEDHRCRQKISRTLVRTLFKAEKRVSPE
jgi:hypothetical protein